MNKLIIKDISINNNEITIKWDLDKIPEQLEIQDINISYDFSLEKEYFYAINILFSLVLPIISIDDTVIEIVSRIPINQQTIDYWTSKLNRIHRKKIELKVSNITNTLFQLPDLSAKDSNDGKLGLFFGGGVESLFALSNIYHKKPVLLSIIGEGWMNNDIPKFSIKQELEDKLISSYELNMQRITTNLRLIVKARDSFMNKWSTGFLFYFLALPIAGHFGLEVLMKSSELEEALNFSDYDMSLNPRTVPAISFPAKNMPIILPAYNGHSKIQMFEELTSGNFIDYLYSCLKNTDKRWCGKCGKCVRISKYCEILGFDKSLIGMQEGIKGKREKSPISRNYWMIMDNLYSKKKSFVSKLLRK